MKLHAVATPPGKFQIRRRTSKVAPALIFLVVFVTTTSIFYPSLRYDTSSHEKLSRRPSSDSPSYDHSSSAEDSSIKLSASTLKVSSITQNLQEEKNQPAGKDVKTHADRPARDGGKLKTVNYKKKSEKNSKKTAAGGGGGDGASSLSSVAKLKCDLYSGEWVPDPNAPYYTNTTCWAIQNHQNCMRFGRTDTEFMKWKWKPNGCDLPTFDPSEFLELVRGKSLAFVGDSVARNHMQSLICLLSKVVYPKDVSNSSDDNFKHWNYETYDFNISIFWSPYLVKTQRTDPNDVTKPFKLYLDEFDDNWTTKIEHFDYVIISAGHWFPRPAMFYLNHNLVGCLYCMNDTVTYLPSSFSYRKAFNTAFKAINELERFKGVVFLRTFAPSHFENGPWDKGGNCVRTKPFRSNETKLEGEVLNMYKIQLEEIRVAEKMGKKRGKRFRLIDVTHPMLLRADGHPSKYGHWPHERVSLANDCVHWCLPGPIDTWNDFLLEMFRRELR